MNHQVLPSSAGLRTILALAVIVLAVAIGSGQEKKEPAAKAVPPKKVTDALTARFPKAKVHKQAKEMEEGREVYDFEFTVDGTKYEADILADGTIANWEQAVTMQALPPAVMTAAGKKYPKATFVEIMAVTALKGGKEKLEGYEILFRTADKKEHEVTFAPDGKVLEEGEGEE